MNKKLFAMMMVPVVVVMGGTFAFSAWSGSANAHFNSQAATVSYTETLSFVATNASSYNPLMLGFNGGNTINDVTSATPGKTLVTLTGNAASTLNVYGNVSGMLPGYWLEFEITVTNTGTATLNTSLLTSTSPVANGAGQVFNSPVPITELQPPVTTQYLNSVMNTGHLGGTISTQGLDFLANATSSSSTPTSLAEGQSVSYTLYAFMPFTALPSAEGTTYSWGIGIPLSPLE